MIIMMIQLIFCFLSCDYDSKLSNFPTFFHSSQVPQKTEQRKHDLMFFLLILCLSLETSAGSNQTSCWVDSGLQALNEGLTDYKLACMDDGVINLFSAELCCTRLLIRIDWDDKEVEENGHFVVLSHTTRCYSVNWDLCCPPKTPLSFISVPLASYFKDHIGLFSSDLTFAKQFGVHKRWPRFSPPPSFFAAISPITPPDNASYGSAMNAISGPCTTSLLTTPQDTAG